MSSNTSFPSSVLFREIHKNAWLRKLPYHNEKKGGALSKVRYIIFFNALYLLIGKSLYVRHLVGKLGYYFLNWTCNRPTFVHKTLSKQTCGSIFTIYISKYLNLAKFVSCFIQI